MRSPQGHMRKLAAQGGGIKNKSVVGIGCLPRTVWVKDAHRDLRGHPLLKITPECRWQELKSEV